MLECNRKIASESVSERNLMIIHNIFVDDDETLFAIWYSAILYLGTFFIVPGHQEPVAQFHSTQISLKNYRIKLKLSGNDFIIMK